MSDDITIVAKSTETPTETHVDNDTAPVASYLDILNPNETDSHQLKTLVEFLRGDAKEMTQSELLHQLRHLELKLGEPRIGERRIERLYRYAKLNAQIKGLESERNALLR